MITVTITRDQTGYREVKAYDHAGYDESGRDIVCAAVSALLINTLNSIESFTEDGFEESENEEAAMISFRFTGQVSERSTLLMDSLVLGLRGIEEDYGSYLSLTVQSEEVE